MMHKKVLYHVGNLAKDRCRDRAVDQFAFKMWRRYQAGECALVQKKRLSNVYEYWAIPVKRVRTYDAAGIRP